MRINRNVPNIITIFRIVLVPVFCLLIFSPAIPKGPWWALFVFVIASISDYVDGYLARKYQLVTAFGKIMDPLADKILVLAAMIALTFTPMYWLNPVVIAIIAFREIAVTILRDYHAKRNNVIAANYWGKWKTVTQMVGITLTLFYYAVVKSTPAHDVLLIIRIYFWGVTLITLLSGMNYFFAKQQPSRNP